MRTHTSRRLLGALAVLATLSLTATACGSDDSDAGTGGTTGPKDIAAALEKGGKVTVWAWEPTLKKVAADFEKKYPKVDVELVNAGTGDKQYTALQNAIAA
ncbi:sugar ABC transporter substrate-binding protein, partial [Streptomyces sp. NPDC047974]